MFKLDIAVECSWSREDVEIGKKSYIEVLVLDEKGSS